MQKKFMNLAKKVYLYNYFIIYKHFILLLASNTLDSVNPGTLKEAYYGLVTLVIEAVKTDSSITDIRFMLKFINLLTLANKLI